jgi:hypothetical protein
VGTSTGEERIQRDVGENRTASEIATDHGCSEELVIYCMKRMRLWQRYEKYAGTRASARFGAGGAPPIPRLAPSRWVIAVRTDPLR